MITRHRLIFFIIFIFGVFLRLYRLDTLPNAYTPDELAQGYTAYSILKTGQDEWGSRNLLSFRSFGDFKPPLQTWLMIPFINLLGLNTLAIRLPNALLSIFSIYLTYRLTQLLFKNPKVSLLATLLFTLSPFTLPLSRLALEANILVFIILLALNLFFSQHYFWSSIFFSLSFLTYHSAKAFTPLLFVWLIIFYRRQFNLKRFALFILPAFLIFTLQLLFNNSSRSSDIAIFNPTDHWQSVSDARYETSQNGLPDFITRIYINKLSYTVSTFINSYLSYFSPQFLIYQGAGETTYGMIPGFGIIGLVGFTGLITALILTFRQKVTATKFLFGLILIVPIAAALAKGTYSGNRVSILSPYLQILCAFGLFHLISIITPLFRPIILLILTLELSSFLIAYFYRGNQSLANGMLYGHQEVNAYLRSFPERKVIYSRQLSEPQTYVAFFQAINPNLTQQESKDWLRYTTEKRSFLDQLPEYKLGQFTFKNINFISDSTSPDTILVGRPNEFIGAKPSYIIYYPSHTSSNPAIYIYQTPVSQKWQNTF